MTDLDLVRAMPTGLELRADDDDQPTLEVRFSVFDQWYEIDSYFEGRFMERTARGAFADTIVEDRANVKVLFDHGHDPSVGNKVLAPIEELFEDTDSPVLRGRLLDTSYNRDLLPGLQAGVYGSSFRFRVTADEWDDEPERSDHNPNGIPERTITKVRLFEAGPVTFPANPEATAGVRSMTDRWYSHARRDDPAAYEAAEAVRNNSPRIIGRPTAEVGGDDGEPQPPDTGRDNARRFAARKVIAR